MGIFLGVAKITNIFRVLDIPDIFFFFFFGGGGGEQLTLGPSLPMKKKMRVPPGNYICTVYLYTFLCFDLYLAFLLRLLCFAFYVLNFVFRKVSFFYCLLPFYFRLFTFVFCV